MRALPFVVPVFGALLALFSGCSVEESGEVVSSPSGSQDVSFSNAAADDLSARSGTSPTSQDPVFRVEDVAHSSSDVAEHTELDVSATAPDSPPPRDAERQSGPEEVSTPPEQDSAQPPADSAPGPVNDAEVPDAGSGPLPSDSAASPVDDAEAADAEAADAEAADAEAADAGSVSPPCVPDCGGKSCGDDGCGGSCGACPSDGGCGAATGCIDGLCTWDDGACDDGDLCTVDVCDSGGECTSAGIAPGPCEWPGQWALSGANPVLSPVASSHPQGADNIYAADVMWHQGSWWMWYGGQGLDGHDAVFLAWSDDLVTWDVYGGANPVPVVDHGASNHVNDPSVVHVGGTFYMYYTEAPVGEQDEVHLATSADGISWAKQGAVIDVGASDSWEPDRVGRPSVLHEDGEFRMWYDGQIFGVARHVGYATSPDGVNWTKHPANPIVLHEGAIDVARIGEWYVLLSESHQGTRMYVAKEPTEWQFIGALFGLSGEAYDTFGQVTPFLLVDQGEAKAVFVGGASDVCWCRNRIAVAFPAGTGCVASCANKACGSDGCGGSCGGCPEGQSCQGGACGASQGGAECAGCLVGFDSCLAACQAAGAASGHCGNPGSMNPDACCTCTDAVASGCEGCLVGYESCSAACQGAGFASGECAAPGSQDPSACCACF